VLDAKFPRAIHSCLIAAEVSMHYITGSPRGFFTNRADRVLGKLLAEIDFMTVEEILAGGLHEFLDALQKRLNQVGTAIFEIFFALHPVGDRGTPQIVE
jgi:uncharacterized alpha-E superfamily protein